MRDTEEYEIGYSEGFESGYDKAIELVIEKVSDEERLRLARESLNFLPFPKIIKLFRLSVSQAEIIVGQAEFEEYVKDKFDLYVEEDGFLGQEDMEGIYQYRLKYAKRDIEDIPVPEIISGSKILSGDMKTLLNDYLKEHKGEINKG